MFPTVHKYGPITLVDSMGKSFRKNARRQEWKYGKMIGKKFGVVKIFWGETFRGSTFCSGSKGSTDAIKCCRPLQGGIF